VFTREPNDQSRSLWVLRRATRFAPACLPNPPLALLSCNLRFKLLLNQKFRSKWLLLKSYLMLVLNTTWQQQSSIQNISRSSRGDAFKVIKLFEWLISDLPAAESWPHIISQLVLPAKKCDVWRLVSWSRSSSSTWTTETKRWTGFSTHLCRYVYEQLCALSFPQFVAVVTLQQDRGTKVVHCLYSAVFRTPIFYCTSHTLAEYLIKFTPSASKTYQRERRNEPPKMVYMHMGPIS